MAAIDDMYEIKRKAESRWPGCRILWYSTQYCVERVEVSIPFGTDCLVRTAWSRWSSMRPRTKRQITHWLSETYDREAVRGNDPIEAILNAVRQDRLAAEAIPAKLERYGMDNEHLNDAIVLVLAKLAAWGAADASDDRLTSEPEPGCGEFWLE